MINEGALICLIVYYYIYHTVLGLILPFEHELILAVVIHVVFLAVQYPELLLGSFSPVQLLLLYYCHNVFYYNFPPRVCLAWFSGAVHDTSLRRFNRAALGSRTPFASPSGEQRGGLG